MAFGKTQELTKRIQSYIKTNMPVKAGGKILDITDLSVFQDYSVLQAP